MNLEKLVRPNIQRLTPYSCARTEFKGVNASVYLDANENPYNANLNRYPDPFQEDLKAELAKVKGIPAEYMFLGNGSDEAIDLVYRIFCEPKEDNVVAIAPTYGMYEVCADINEVEYRPVLLDDDFQLDADKLLAACDAHTKVVWMCSPNNPTGNCMKREEIVKVLNGFQGIVVIDEAYSDFTLERPFRYELPQYPNLIVLNTMSKAWASAAIRLGMAFASPDIIALFNKVKYPYNVNLLTEAAGIASLQRDEYNMKNCEIIMETRRVYGQRLRELGFEMTDSRTNFLFVRHPAIRGEKLYQELKKRDILVRHFSKERILDYNRITVGTPEQMEKLIEAIKQILGNGDLQTAGNGKT